MEADNPTLWASDSSPGPREPVALQAGTRVGRYSVLSQLGRGAMGAVYAAYDPELDRRVALKLLHPPVGQPDPRQRDRMLREAQAMAKLTAPNVVAVHDVGTVGASHDDAVFLAMEYVDGFTLGQWREHEKPSRSVLLDVLIQAGRGLAAAHRAGLIHRDFKPANVLVTAQDRGRADHWTALVTDFGLVRAAEREDEMLTTAESLPAPPAGDKPIAFDATLPVASSGSASVSGSSRLALRLTGTGAYVGTPAYMSPEQFRGEALDHRTDQFAFCVTAYELLIGERPFAGASLVELYTAVTKGKLEALPAGVEVPARIIRALRRGLAVDRQARFEDMEALLTELGREATPWRRYAGAMLLGGGLLVGVATVTPDGGSNCDREAFAEQVWGDEQRRTIASAFERHDSPYVQQSRSRVTAALQSWSEQWAEASMAACAGSDGTDPTLIPRRDRCYEDRRRTTAALVSAFADADRRTIDRAASAVESLPSLTPCTNAEYLSVSVAMPPEQIADRVAELEDETARRNALALLRPDDASEGLAALLERAQQTGFKPLVAEVGLAVALVEYRRGRTADAIDAATSAYVDGLDVGADEAAARTARLLAQMLANDTKTIELARHWLLQARTLGRRAHLDDRFGLSIALAEASIASKERDPESVRLYSEVLEQARTLGADPIRTAKIESGLAAALFLAGRTDEATHHGQAALATERELLGPEHPRTLETQVSVATSLLRASDDAEGREMLLDALQRYERSVDGPTMQKATVHATLAVNYARTDRLEAAQEELQLAIDQWTAVFGPEHASIAKALEQLAELDTLQEQYARGRTRARKAVAMARSLFGPTDRRLIDPLLILARLDVEAGDVKAASEHLARADALASELPPSNPVVSLVLLQRGRFEIERDIEGGQAKVVAALDAAQRLKVDRRETAMKAAMVLAEHGTDRADRQRGLDHLHTLLESELEVPTRVRVLRKLADLLPPTEATQAAALRAEADSVLAAATADAPAQ